MRLELGYLFRILGILGIILREIRVDIEGLVDMPLRDIELGKRRCGNNLGHHFERCFVLNRRGRRKGTIEDGERLFIGRVEHTDGHPRLPCAHLIARSLKAVEQETLGGEVPGRARHSLFKLSDGFCDLLLGQINFTKQNAGSAVNRMMLKAGGEHFDGLVGLAFFPDQAGKREKGRRGGIVLEQRLKGLDSDFRIARSGCHRVLPDGGKPDSNINRLAKVLFSDKT